MCDREHQMYLEKVYGDKNVQRPLPVDPRASVTTGRMYEWELAQERARRDLADERFYKGVR